jgi:hypothetical protein
VLHEMLTGRSPFLRATVTDTLGAVVDREPDWTALPAATPPMVLRLMRHCLEKEPKLRLRDIGDAVLKDVDGPRCQRSLRPLKTDQRAPANRRCRAPWRPRVWVPHRRLALRPAPDAVPCSIVSCD